MVDVKGQDLVILMRVKNYDNMVEFVPFKVVYGSYIKSERLFLDYETGNSYIHVGEAAYFDSLEEYDNIVFYGFRLSVDKIREECANIDISEFEDMFLEEVLKNKYQLAMRAYEDNTVNFFIASINKETGKIYPMEDLDTKLFRLNNNTADKKSSDIDKKVDYSFDRYELAKALKKDVFGQDDAIDKIVLSLWCNYYDIDKEDYSKENILVIGPTGVGKTEIFRCIKNFFSDIVVHIADLTNITESGFKGDSVNELMVGLLMNCIEVCNGKQYVNVEKANHAIFVLDEFDKIAFSDSNSTDVGDKPVQQELLKVIEGKEMFIEMKLNNEAQIIPINTSKMTFVCCGAFEGITKFKDKEMGFNADVLKSNNSKNYSDITKKDLMKYGFIPEILGRLPSVVILNNLSMEVMVDIVKKPRRNLFTKKLGILNSIVPEVEVKEDLYFEIAKKAFNGNIGARGLDEIGVDLFNHVLSEVSNPDYEYPYVLLDGETVKNPKKYVLKKVPKREKNIDV